MPKVSTTAPRNKNRSAQRDPQERDKLPLRTRVIVLTEAGYRCAVPTCRNILALDLHHIWQVSSGGSDDPANLIALCPNCHALYHRKIIAQDSIYAYKAMLVAISSAFDVAAIDQLLFLESCKKDFLVVSGDGLLLFSRLIAAGLAVGERKANNNWQVVTYTVNLTPKGRLLTSAWKAGDRVKVGQAIGVSPTGNDTGKA